MTCNLFTTCIFFCPSLLCDSLKKPLNCAPLPTCGFAAQLVRELNQYLEGMGSIPFEALIFLPRLLFCSSPPNIIAFLELIVLKKFGWEGRFEREAHRNQFAYCFVSFIILFPGPLQSNSRSHATCYDTLERKCRKAGL